MELIWQDLAISFGSIVGLLSKAYGLWDTDTRWSRLASLPNAVLYLPSIAAFISYDLWLTAITATLNMCVWFGIALFRATDDSDESSSD